MGYSLHWNEYNLQSVAEDFNDKVAGALEEALKDKDRQIRWKNDIAGLSKRFHNTFGLGGLQIAEIRFTAESAEYRAICVIIEEKKAVAYYGTVPKKGSKQERFLETIRINSDKVKEAILKRFDQEFS